MLDYNLTLNNRSRDTAFLELFDDKPLTTANFLYYVNNTGVNHGNYNGSFMHRLAPNFVIQGGGYWPNVIPEPPPVNVSLDPTAVVDRDGNPLTSNPTVMGESGVGTFRSNLPGTVAMALSTGPNSGTNQWFINLADNSFLDVATFPNGQPTGGPFTVFAKVAGDGMTLFNAFNGLPYTDLNPDINNDGFRDDGPFGNYDNFGNLTDGVPYLQGASGDLLVLLEKATQIDYLGSGLNTIVPSGGLTFSTRDAFIDTGTTFTNQSTTTGPLTIGAGRSLGIREGFTLNRALINHGALEPGLQLGLITVQSDYYQFADGTLKTQLRGTIADTEYDKLNVSGIAYLGGKLEVSLISGYTPAPGSSYTVLSAAALTGNFSSVVLPVLSDGLVWGYSRGSTAINLTVASADFNRNGVVDAADYILWRKTRETTGLPAYSGADGNGDGIINSADLVIWRANLGRTSGGTLSFGAGAGAGTLAGSTVPEPSALILALTAAMITTTCRARRTLKTP
jgi:cyclophilin family peptidyl-prolyl cis-trans isomerase